MRNAVLHALVAAAAGYNSLRDGPRDAMLSSIDCAALVTPVDVSPVRSPQAVHTLLARRFAGKDILEIGTRNGDGMACFAQTAHSAVAVEYEPRYCAILRKRAATLAEQGSGNFSVHCADYRNGLPAADVYTWWQQEPDLADATLLRNLRLMKNLRKGAKAVLLFDNSWYADMGSWQKLQAEVSWFERVKYNERADCLAKYRPWGDASNAPKDGPIQWGYTCKRANGTFYVAGIDLSPPDVEI